METPNLHLISDSTGETIGMLARACLVQFEELDVTEHVWPMVRRKNDLKQVLDSIAAKPGLVLFTIVNPAVRTALEEGCEALGVPYLCALDPVTSALGGFLKAEAQARPGRQHTLSAANFERVDAINFALNHDDGQSVGTLHRADVILVGVSRTSKTPTCIYLANRGLKAANVPIVPGFPLPQELLDLSRPLVVGLTKDPKRLIQVRKNRLEVLQQDPRSDYADVEIVRREVAEAQRICAEHDWPVLDVTRKSIEETATAIKQLLKARSESLG